MKCAKCSHGNIDGVKFCGECGAKLYEKCGACGADNSAATKFCGSCGKKLAADGGAVTSLVVFNPAEVVKAYSAKLTSSSYYLAGAIPEKKFKNAGSYIVCTEGAEDGEDTIFLHDDTMFGSAKDGSLFTTHAVYVHNASESPYKLNYSDIKSVNHLGDSGKEIVLNGNFKISMHCSNVESVAVLVEMFQSIIAGYAKTKSSSEKLPKESLPEEKPKILMNEEPAIQTLEGAEFDVVLTDSGNKKLELISVIRGLTNLGLVEAKRLVEGCPAVVKERVEKKVAEEMKRRIEAAGATAEIRSCPDDQDDDDDEADVEELIDEEGGMEADEPAEDESKGDGDTEPGTIKRITGGKYDGFIALSVAPDALDVADIYEDMGEQEWSENVSGEIRSKLIEAIGSKSAKFEELTDDFYYFKYGKSDVTPVGYLIDTDGAGLGCGADGSYLAAGEGSDSERVSIATYDLSRVEAELENLPSDKILGVDIRLFRLCGTNSDNLSVDIEDLSELESPEDGDLMLNDMSRRVAEEELGDGIEGYVCKDDVVAYQAWEDGGLGDEGCLADPDDEDYRFEPNEDALVTLFGGIGGAADVESNWNRLLKLDVSGVGGEMQFHRLDESELMALKTSYLESPDDFPSDQLNGGESFGETVHSGNYGVYIDNMSLVNSETEEDVDIDMDEQSTQVKFLDDEEFKKDMANYFYLTRGDVFGTIMVPLMEDDGFEPSKLHFDYVEYSFGGYSEEFGKILTSVTYDGRECEMEISDNGQDIRRIITLPVFDDEDSLADVKVVLDQNGDDLTIDFDSEAGDDDSRVDEASDALDGMLNVEGTIKVELKLNGVEVPVGFDLLENIASSVNDRAENAAIFRELAKSPNRAVRERVAGKDHIDEETALMLAEDSDEEVVASLLGSEGRKLLPQVVIEKSIQRSARLANVVAERVSDLNEECDTEPIVGMLAAHPDPSVRKAIAGNYDVSKVAKKALLKDPEPDVAAEAASSLED